MPKALESIAQERERLWNGWPRLGHIPVCKMICLILTRLREFFRRPIARQRACLSLFALPVCLGLLVGACGTQPRPPNGINGEELRDFRQFMQKSANKAGDYLAMTMDGKNISEMTLGWFVYNVLTELSSQDDELYNYFNGNGQDLQRFLKHRFHDHPLEEIAALDGLAGKAHPTIRRCARSALETLRHIPDPGEALEIQIRDRQELAVALANLRDLLQKNAGEPL